MNPDEHGDCSYGRVDILPETSIVTLYPAGRTFRVIPLDVKTPGKIWSNDPEFVNLEFKPTCGPDGQTPGCSVFKNGQLDFSGTVDCTAVCTGLEPGHQCVAVFKIESGTYGHYGFFNRDGEMRQGLGRDHNPLSNILTPGTGSYNGIGGPRVMFVGQCYCTGDEATEPCDHQRGSRSNNLNHVLTNPANTVFVVESCTSQRADFQWRSRLQKHVSYEFDWPQSPSAREWCATGRLLNGKLTTDWERDWRNGIVTYIMCADPDNLNHIAARISASPTANPTTSPTANPTNNPSQAPTKFPTTASPVTKSPVTKSPVTKSPVTKSPTLSVTTSRPISADSKRKMIKFCLECKDNAPESDVGSCASKKEAVMRSFCEQNDAPNSEQDCAEQLGIEGIDYLLDSWCDNGEQRRLQSAGTAKDYMFRIMFDSDAPTLPLDGNQCAGIMGDLGTKENRCSEGIVDTEGTFMPLEPVKSDDSIFGLGTGADIGISVLLIATVIAILGAVLWCLQSKKKEKEGSVKVFASQKEIEAKALKVDEEIGQTDGGMP